MQTDGDPTQPVPASEVEGPVSQRRAIAGSSGEDPFRVGVTISGRYRIERPLAESPSGMLVMARHLSLDETVTIRFPRPELCREPSVIAHFEREAKALSRVKSAHVARVIDVGVSMAVGPYIVMEHLEGSDLRSLLRSGRPLRVALAVEYALQACEALVAAHAEGVTHRNIKPESLFLARHAEAETLKLLDFGISRDTPQRRLRDPLAAPSSGAPTGLVSSPYTAPELRVDDARADARSDIWALGVVLYELVTGCTPVEGDASGAEAHASAGALASTAGERQLPPLLRAVLGRCLQRDPSRRYQCVEELAAALLPLESMAERTRGRMTGTFRLSEEFLDAVKVAPPARKLSAAQRFTRLGGLLSWPVARRLGALRVAVADRLWLLTQAARASDVVAPQAIVVAVIGLGCVILSAVYVGGVSLMQPPARLVVGSAPAVAAEPAPAQAPAPAEGIASSARALMPSPSAPPLDVAPVSTEEKRSERSGREERERSSATSSRTRKARRAAAAVNPREGATPNRAKAERMRLVGGGGKLRLVSPDPSTSVVPGTPSFRH